MPHAAPLPTPLPTQPLLTPKSGFSRSSSGRKRGDHFPPTLLRSMATVQPAVEHPYRPAPALISLEAGAGITARGRGPPGVSDRFSHTFLANEKFPLPSTQLGFF